MISHNFLKEKTVEFSPTSLAITFETRGRGGRRRRAKRVQERPVPLTIDRKGEQNRFRKGQYLFNHRQKRRSKQVRERPVPLTIGRKGDQKPFRKGQYF